MARVCNVSTVIIVDTMVLAVVAFIALFCPIRFWVLVNSYTDFSNMENVIWSPNGLVISLDSSVLCGFYREQFLHLGSSFCIWGAVFAFGEQFLL